MNTYSNIEISNATRTVDYYLKVVNNIATAICVVMLSITERNDRQS